jgi:putative spermidine/putrescine transport system permease protein
LIAMQWLGVDPAGAQSLRAAAKRKRALLKRETPGQTRIHSVEAAR